jgi:hypothetical protein
VLETTKISPGLYRNWLRSKEWQEAFAERIEGCRRQAQLVLSNFLVTATAKLVTLTQSDNEETSRKACIDILEMKSLITESIKSLEPDTKLSDKKVEQIMRVLSDEEEKNVK